MYETLFNDWKFLRVKIEFCRPRKDSKIKIWVSKQKNVTKCNQNCLKLNFEGPKIDKELSKNWIFPQKPIKTVKNKPNMTKNKHDTVTKIDRTVQKLNYAAAKSIPNQRENPQTITFLYKS